jgi:phage/plasmid-like protein (TIGR03299 family)
MSEETQEWLSTMVKVGFTEQRGNAWHYRKGDNNHFPGAVPITVAHELFDFEVVKLPIYVDNTPVEGMEAVYAPDYAKVFGFFSDGYTIHPYNEWLVQHTNTLLDGDLQIGSCGLLRERAIAFLQAEVPDSFTDAETGEKIRGSVLASTSLDGSTATGYDIVFTRVVCDNTLRMAQGEKTGKRYRLRHTKNSKVRFEDAMEALGLVQAEAELMLGQIHDLARTPVTSMQWHDFLTVHVPRPSEKGRGQTMADNKRDALSTLWTTDERVAPWAGTAWGVVQAVNTYNQHLATVRSTAARFERNMLKTIDGSLSNADRKALADLDKILSVV